MRKTISCVLLLFLILQYLFADDDLDIKRQKWDVDSYSILYNDTAWRILYGGEINLLEKALPMMSLARLDARQHRLLRNTIYAKYGYNFRSVDLKYFFQHFDWYETDPGFSESQFSKIDQINIAKLLIYEEAYRSKSVLNIEKKDLIGVWQGSPVMASGWGDRFAFHNDGRLRWFSNQMFGAKRLLEYNGTWRIDGHILVFSVNETIYYKDGKISKDFNPMNGFFIEPSEKYSTQQYPAVEYRIPIGKPKLWNHEEIGDRWSVSLGGEILFRMEDNPDLFN